MKLIINISDESYDKALNGIINCKECFDAIVYGTPIPDNATNGDVIKAIFPQIKVTEHKNPSIVEIENMDGSNVYSADWWNMQYQN